MTGKASQQSYIFTIIPKEISKNGEILGEAKII